MTTFIYLYYNNPPAFEHLSKTALPQHKVIKLFVDDGSNPPLKIDNALWVNTDLIRIEEDIPWNQPRANNLAFERINAGKILRLDIDHWFEKDAIEELLKIEVPPKTVYRFKRIAHYKDKPPSKINVGKNIYLANVEDLLAIGGYNEAFTGNYGYEDGELLHRMKLNNFKIVTHESIYCHVTVHHHTQKLNRDTTINKAKYDKIVEKGTKTFTSYVSYKVKLLITNKTLIL